MTLVSKQLKKQGVLLDEERAQKLSCPSVLHHIWSQFLSLVSFYNTADVLRPDHIKCDLQSLSGEDPKAWEVKLILDLFVTLRNLQADSRHNERP